MAVRQTRLPIALSVLFAAGAARAQVPVFAEQAVSRGVEYTVTDGIFGGSGQFGCGVALVDLDNDGDDDIIGTGATNGQIALFANDGTGVFTNVTAASGLAAHTKVSGVVAG
ncbi:MAG: FG-GAP-like repeat-containing protein, partial [Phycisphaerales bacterium]